MDTIGTIWKFETRNFTVVVDAVEEHDLDLSWDESGEVAEKIESGHLTPFCARARVLLLGNVIGENLLGNCIYESLEDFRNHMECAKQTRELRKQGSTAIVGSYFADMVHEAIKEARQTMTKYKAVKIKGAA